MIAVPAKKENLAGVGRPGEILRRILPPARRGGRSQCRHQAAPAPAARASRTVVSGFPDRFANRRPRVPCRWPAPLPGLTACLWRRAWSPTFHAGISSGMVCVSADRPLPSTRRRGTGSMAVLIGESALPAPGASSFESCYAADNPAHREVSRRTGGRPCLPPGVGCGGFGGRAGLPGGRSSSGAQTRKHDRDSFHEAGSKTSPVTMH